MRYEERVIDEVQSLNDIVDIISNYLPLKKSGRTFKACCPFHQEKTPSFIVHPEKQIFHCFGCSAGGNVFSFLMKYENLTFPEALRNLAARVNYPLPEATQRAPAEVSETESLYEVYRLAQEYYIENLKHPEKGAAGRNYLKKRGLGEGIFKETPLGYATTDWRGLFEFLMRREIKDAVAYRSGLIQKGREGHPYDLFRGRLMFPIHNSQGKVIALGGRALGDETPKYLNSPESPIFRKRRELYGLHLAKRALPTEGRILIVEGYFDCLKVYWSGFQNVVATLGTALSEDHVRILKRYVQEAVVIFDGDKAGEAASLRGLEIFLEGEMSVKVASLPAGKDPDTFIEEKGADAFKQLIDGAADFFDFKWNLLSRRHKTTDPAGLLKISTEFLETLSKIKNPILLDRYLRQLAGLLGIGENALRTKLAERLRKDQARDAKTPSSQTSVSRTEVTFPEEGTIVGLLLEEPKLWGKAEAEISADDFRHPSARQVFEWLKHNQGTSLSYHKLLNRLEDETIKSFIVSHSMSELSFAEKEKALGDCVKKVKRRRMDEHLEHLRRAISLAEGKGENNRVSELLKEYRSLLSERV